MTTTVRPQVTSTVTVRIKQIGPQGIEGGGGSVTSVTGTSPVVSSGGLTPAISLPAATNASAGHATAAHITAIETNTAKVAGASNLGYMNIPQITKVNDGAPTTGADLTYSGKHVYHTGTAGTFTIPSNASIAFPVGTAISFVNGDGAGDLTIAIDTDTMRLAGAGTTGSRTLAANGSATALKISTTEWIISGSGLT